MCPITHVSFLVLGVTVIISFIFGFLWYGPLFGKLWANLALGIKDCKGDGKPPVSALLLTFLGTILQTVVLGYLLYAAKPCCNFGMAAAVWIGFYVPLMLSTKAWEGKPWKLLALNGTFYFLNLQLIAAILTYWK